MLTVLVGSVSFSTALPALAAETSNSEFVIIRPDDILDDDLYAGAIKVLVEGEIDGDLIAFAGEEIVIDGLVTGSVFAFAPRVTVNGTVGRSLRVSANDLRVNGTVGRDVVAAAVDVQLGEDSSVGKDVLIWAVEVGALGHIGGDLTGSQRTLALAGSVDGDVDVSVGRLEIVDDLTVGGDLGYRSHNEAEDLDNATVDGAVVHKTPLPPNIRVRALGFFGRFLVILFLTIAALTMAWGWPDRTQRAIGMVGRAAWGRGALVMFSPLLLAAVAGLILGLAPASASFPLLAILGPLVLAAVGVVLALCFVAGIPTVGRLGSFLFKKLDVYGSILAGSALTGLLWLLPVIGLIVPFVVLPLGLGAWISSWRSTGDEAGEESGLGV